MRSSIDLEKERLEREKEKLQLRERLLREKEKQKKIRWFTEIGKIAEQAGIDVLDKASLLGAFLEIAEKQTRDEVLKTWKENGEGFLKKKEESNELLPLSVSFQSDPNRDVKDKLKAYGFKWNSFRKEFLGYGEKTKIQNLIAHLNPKIEVLR